MRKNIYTTHLELENRACGYPLQAGLAGHPIELMGRLFAVPDSNPLGLTLFVQAANGLVLAVIALFLIYDMY